MLFEYFVAVVRKERGMVLYDVCIVGAGPHALAVLSAIRKHRRDAVTVCVVDPTGKWLSQWDHAFASLGIEHLRSPAWAHPDATSQEALVDFARRTGRMDEFKCVSFNGTSLEGKTNCGYYKNPGTKLFRDFCDSLIDGLQHDFISGRVTDVRIRSSTCLCEPTLREVIIEGSEPEAILARHVVLALGGGGCPNIPAPFKGLCCPGTNIRVVHSSDCQSLVTLVTGRLRKDDTVLVIGGGLSAAQATLLASQHGARRTILCSRRTLVSQHYDLPLEWMDDRMGKKDVRNRNRLSGYFSLSPADRIKACAEIRGGGSIPPDYMDALDQCVNTGRLEIIVGSVRKCEQETENSMRVCLDDGSAIMASYVILATGCSMDCMQVPLLRALATRYDMRTHSGFPLLNDNLVWDERCSIMGAFAAPFLAPDALNLIGARKGGALAAMGMEQEGKIWRKKKFIRDEFSLEA